MAKKKVRFHCKSEAQKKAIRKSYAEKSAKEKRRIEAAYPHFSVLSKIKTPCADRWRAKRHKANGAG